MTEQDELFPTTPAIVVAAQDAVRAAREAHRRAKDHEQAVEHRRDAVGAGVTVAELTEARTAVQLTRSELGAALRAEQDAERQAIADANRPIEQERAERRERARAEQAARDEATLAAIANGTAPNAPTNLSRK